MILGGTAGLVLPRVFLAQKAVSAGASTGCVGRLSEEMAVRGKEEGAWLLEAASTRTAVQR